MLEHRDYQDEKETSHGTDEGADRLALTAAQSDIWIDCSIDPTRTNYNIGEYLEIRGEIDLPVFRAAFGRVIDETETLHVRFVADNDELRQVRVGSVDLPLTFLDLSADPAPRASAEKWIENDNARPIDPLSGPLCAFALLRLGPDTWYWCVRYHHMINDGSGMAMVTRRLAEIYTAIVEGRDAGPSPFGTLVDLIREDHGYRQSDHFARDRSYWAERLTSSPPAVNLSKREPARSVRFMRRTAYIPLGDVQALRALAKSLGSTLPQIITTAVAIYLHQMTGEEDLVFGYSVSGRLGTRASSMVGVLSNVAPIRVAVDSDTPFGELARRMARFLREGLRHQRYRIADIRRDLRRLDQPLYEVLVNVMAFEYDMTFAGARVVAHHNLGIGPISDLSVVIYDHLAGEDLRIDFDANPLRHSPEEIEAHLSRFVALLSGLIEAGLERDPTKCVGYLPIVTAQERAKLLGMWGSSGSAYQVKQTLHQMFEAQVERTPDAIAVSFGDKQISYRELNSWSNRVAHALRARGVGRDRLVGLRLDRDIELIVAVLGILKAGGGYLPIDVSYPDDRVAFMLEDTAAAVVVSDAANASRLTAHADKIFWIDRPELFESFPTENPVVASSPDDLAYVIYTSGSTGRPKGVLIPHRNVVRLFLATEPWFGFSGGDVWTLFHSPAFDFSVWEIWGALLYGGRVVVVPYLVSRSPAEFRMLLSRQRVTVLNQTPTAFNQLVHADAEVSDELSLRYVIFGGEALEMRNLVPWFERHGDRRPQLINMYGITETTVHVTYRPLGLADTTGGSVVGVPIPDLQVHVLNPKLQPLPVGVAGEMFVGGAGLARGYLNRPELTAERFLPNPFSSEPGSWLYRSGDGARILPTGEIEYLGRLDQQVKIRGFRIELGEIEAAIRQHPSVREAAVISLDDGSGDKRLVAYVVPAVMDAPPIDELRALLARSLPDYMVPSAFVAIAALPLTNNGKLDRKALPVPDIETARAEKIYVAPRSNIEFAIAETWARVLGVEKPSVQDDFFECGGHSLAAVRLINEINRTLNIKLGLAALFQFPTIERLAAFAVKNVQPLVVRMAAGAEATPVYVIYAGNHQFRIARVLGGRRPVFGIDVPYRTSWCEAAAQKRDGDLPQMDELVEPFLEALKAHTGGAPCILAGHCFGGLIAFETARRYSETGGKVEAVILLDSFRVVPNSWQLAKERLRRRWAMIGKSRGQEAVDTSPLTESWRTLRWLAGQLARIGWKGMKMRLSDVVAPELTGMRDENGGFVQGPSLNRIYNKIYETFAPARAPTVGILVRAQSANDAEMPYRELDPTLGWGTAFDGGLHIFEAKGDHLSMIEIDENLRALGDQVNRELDRVIAGGRSLSADRSLQMAS